MIFQPLKLHLLYVDVIEPAERESRRAPMRESCTTKGLPDSLGEFFNILAHFEPFSPIPFGSLLRLWRGLRDFVLVDFGSLWRPWKGSRGLRFGPFWLSLASLEGPQGLRFGSFWLPCGVAEEVSVEESRIAYEMR